MPFFSEHDAMSALCGESDVCRNQVRQVWRHFEIKQMKKPLLLKAGIFLMQLNALLILYYVALHISVANFDSFHISDSNAIRLILIAVAILKLALAQLMTNGVNWASMWCWVFVFWPYGSGSIHEMNMFVMNHVSLLMLFLPPSNRWFKMARVMRRLKV
jgi:hypothetical protein